MGLFSKIGKALFGGGKTGEQESGNSAYGDIKGAFMPSAQQFGAGYGQAANMLGLGGSEAQSDAVNGWWNSSGGNFLLNQGMDDVDAFYRAKGLGQSGATIKGIEELRSNLASTKLNEYMGNLFNLNQQALGAGALVSDAGRYSKGSSSDGGGGLGKAIGTALAIFSDRRLKTDIVKTGEDADGLGRYRYRYHNDPTVREGVMADEVAKLRPWALGPTIGGFATVRYDLLENAHV